MFDFCVKAPPLSAHFKLCSPAQIFVLFPKPEQHQSTPSREPLLWMQDIRIRIIMSNKHRLLVKNASQVVVICNHGERFMTKHGMQKLSVIENGSVVIGR